jgi:hypothetical protein
MQMPKPDQPDRELLAAFNDMGNLPDAERRQAAFARMQKSARLRPAVRLAHQGSGGPPPRKVVRARAYPAPVQRVVRVTAVQPPTHVATFCGVHTSSPGRVRWLRLAVLDVLEEVHRLVAHLERPLSNLAM